MKLIDGWKQVLTGSWSVRFGALAAFFSALAAAAAPDGPLQPLFPSLESIFGLESGTLATIAALFGVLVGVARVTPQPKLHERIADAAEKAVTRPEDAFRVGSEEWLKALRERIGQ